MNETRKILFSLHAKTDGQEVTPSICTGELREVRLLAFVGEGPSYDEQELEVAIEKGTRAWADVPDSVAWVREQRGAYDE